MNSLECILRPRDLVASCDTLTAIQVSTIIDARFGLSLNNMTRWLLAKSLSLRHG